MINEPINFSQYLIPPACNNFLSVRVIPMVLDTITIPELYIFYMYFLRAQNHSSPALKSMIEITINYIARIFLDLDGDINKATVKV